MVVFSFKVTYYAPDTDTNENDQGFLYASNFIDATSQLVDYYGNELETVTLDEFPNEILTLHEATFQKVCGELNEEWN